MGMVYGAAATDERSQITSASVEAVWRVWSDATSWPKWSADVRGFELNGFFDDGVRGRLTTSMGTYDVALIDVVQEESFTMVLSQAALTTSYYRCTIRPLPDGQTRISASISVRGPLASVVGPQVRERAVKSFEPSLKALAARAERIEKGRVPQPVTSGHQVKVTEVGTDE